MFDYLQQFNALPADLRAKVSSPEAVKEIEVLEKKFGVDLAAIVMQVMVKELKLESLGLYLASEYHLSEAQASDLIFDLKSKVFNNVSEYLGFAPLKLKISLEDKLASVIAPVDEEIKVAPVKETFAEVKPSGQPVPATSTTSSPIKPIQPAKPAPVEKVLDEYSIKVEECLDKTFKELSLSLSPESIDRLRSILKLYLRGVKIRIDVRITLNKPENQGGLNLGDKEVSRIFKVLAKNQKELLLNINKSIKPSLGVLEKISKLDPRVAAMDENYLANKFLDVKHELSAPKSASNKELEAPKPVLAPNILPSTPIVPPAPKVVSPVVPPKTGPADILSSIPVIKTPEIQTPEAPKLNIQTPPQSVEKKVVTDIVGSKVKMEDVKKIKIMSPIDELRFLDLVNFRRLGKNTKEITLKIKEKIILLGKDDYENLVAGINAWRQSPVNKLYLSIAKEAAIQGLPLKTVAESRRIARKDYLSMEEIEAVIDLNTVLMY